MFPHFLLWLYKCFLGTFECLGKGMECTRSRAYFNHHYVCWWWTGEFPRLCFPWVTLTFVVRYAHRVESDSQLVKYHSPTIIISNVLLSPGGSRTKDIQIFDEPDSSSSRHAFRNDDELTPSTFNDFNHDPQAMGDFTCGCSIRTCGYLCGILSCTTHFDTPRQTSH